LYTTPENDKGKFKRLKWNSQQNEGVQTKMHSVGRVWIILSLDMWTMLSFSHEKYSKNPHTRKCGLRTPRLKFGKKGAYI